MNWVWFGWMILLTAASGAQGEPQVTHTDVFVSGQHGCHAYRIPAIETAADGSLIAFAEARKYNMDDPGHGKQDIDLVYKRSTETSRPGTDDMQTRARSSDDHGRTWSESRDLTAAGRDLSDLSWRASVPGPGGVIQTRNGRRLVPMWKGPFANFTIGGGRKAATAV